jgi:hypothetical protein
MKIHLLLRPLSLSKFNSSIKALDKLHHKLICSDPGMQEGVKKHGWSLIKLKPQVRLQKNMDDMPVIVQVWPPRKVVPDCPSSWQVMF